MNIAKNALIDRISILCGKHYLNIHPSIVRLKNKFPKQTWQRGTMHEYMVGINFAQIFKSHKRRTYDNTTVQFAVKAL